MNGLGRVGPRCQQTVLIVGVVVAVLVGGLAGALKPVYHGAIRLLATTIGVGPSFDGFGLSIPLLFNGTVIPAGDTFHTVPYPAQINLDYPFISDLPLLSDLPYWPHSLKQSERIGAGLLEQDLARTPATSQVTVIGYSQGTQVAEIARADMAKDPAYVANADKYHFVLVGDPYQPNGGILSRFTSWSEAQGIGDLFPFGRPGPSDSPFRTTYYQNQYDGFADFPAYFSLLSVTNALVGILFEHVVPGYVFDDPTESNVVSTTVGNTTYVTIPHLLPLLAPLRLAASLVGAQRLVDALDPIVRVFVEMGYDRTADPSQVKEFAWSIPEEKVREAHDALPAAFAQSMAILGGAIYTPTVPVPVVASEQPATPVTEHPAIPVDNSPAAQAVHDTVSGVANVLGAGSQTVAWALRTISGKEPLEEGAADSGAAAADETSVGQRDVAATRSQNRTAQPADEPEPEATTEPEATEDVTKDPESTKEPEATGDVTKDPESTKDPEPTTGPETKSDDRSAAAPVG